MIQLNKVPVLLKNARVQFGLLVMPSINALAETQELLFVVTRAYLIKYTFQGSCSICSISYCSNSFRSFFFLLAATVLGWRIRLDIFSLLFLFSLLVQLRDR